jgi:hypothetical protein
VQIVAIAIVRSDDPQVFVAEDMESLHWILALRLVAPTDPASLPDGTVSYLRAALLEERWSDAVLEWMRVTGEIVDVYPSHDLYTAADVEMAASELQFTRLFLGADGDG